MAELGITHVQTAVRGCRAAVPITITPTEKEDEYNVSCPNAKVSSQPTRKRFKAVFPAEKCADCPHAKKCPAGKRKAGHRVFYFTRPQAAASARQHNIETIPAQRRTLRANVEATVKEFTAPFNHKGKLKVRGAFATALVAFSMAIAINFGRVRRALTEEAGGDPAASAGASTATGADTDRSTPGDQGRQRALSRDADRTIRARETERRTAAANNVVSTAERPRKPARNERTATVHRFAPWFWLLRAGLARAFSATAGFTPSTPLSLRVAPV
jgi:hypothetical protein